MADSTSGYLSRLGLRGERTAEAIPAATNIGETRSLGPRKRRKPFQAMIAHWLQELGLANVCEIHEAVEGSSLYRTSAATHRKSSHVMLTYIGVGSGSAGQCLKVPQKEQLWLQ